MQLTSTTSATRTRRSLKIAKGHLQILLAEDEDAIRQLIQLCLEREGYQVIAVSNGHEALHAFAMNAVDLVLLDVTMPRLNGWTVCTELRKQTSVPIMILTAHSHSTDVSQGIHLGADSYVTKPFTLKELCARVMAVMRRASLAEQNVTDNTVVCGDLLLNMDAQQVTARGKKVDLTPTEYQTLAYLMHHPDKDISKEELFSVVWGGAHDLYEDMNIVRVAIRRLRSKIETAPSSPAHLKTVWEYGYRLCTGFGDDDRCAEG